MMRVFLGNGPWCKEGAYGVRAGSRWPHFEETCSRYIPFPFYLAYATAVLEREGHDCCLGDGIAERITEEQFLSRIEKFHPDLIVLEVSTASIDTDLRQAREAKKQCPQSSVVFCGPHLDMYEAAFFERVPEVDYVLQGEYEYILRDLVSALDSGGKMEAIRGLGFRGPNGEGIVNPRAEVIRDLDSLPWPSRNHLPMLNYYDQPGAIPEPTLQIWASRGCPFQCVFCAWPQIMYGNNLYRTRNPVDVVDEIEAMRNEYGFRSVYFDDDTFNIGKKRILALCEEMRKRNLGLPWAAMARADTTDRETLQAMKDAGLVAIKYGVESASQELIDRAKKGLDLDRVEETVRITRELGIRQHLTFSFGLPGETWDTIRKTIDLSKRLDPETVQYSIMTPYPGSSFYQDMRNAGMIVTEDFSQYDGMSTAVIRTESLSPADLEHALKQAYREWEWHKLVRPFRHPRHLKRLLAHPRGTWNSLKFTLSRHRLFSRV
ncbi:MAG TPA: radical SAM protein [bacterium]|nr:radical SAM protein [bacterium]HQQ00943.1 radical SAM protein [bacterium]